MHRALLRLLSLIDFGSLMGFGSSRRRFVFIATSEQRHTAGARGHTERAGGASDLLSFDMLRVHGGLARHAASFVHQIKAVRATTGAGREFDQWMTLQMSTAYRRGLRRRRNGGAGSATTGSEYVCNHHVKRRSGKGGSAQTVEFETSVRSWGLAHHAGGLSSSREQCAGARQSSGC